VTALEREWAARLRASGFQDLEGADRDGPLSDRGNLHAVAETAEEDARLADRMAAGEAEIERRRAILHAHRFRSAIEREVWRLHADGEGERAIAAATGLTRDRARKLLAAVRRRVTRVRRVKQWRDHGKQQRREFQRHLTRCDPKALMQVAAVLAQGLTRKRSLSSSWR